MPPKRLGAGSKVNGKAKVVKPTAGLQKMAPAAGESTSPPSPCSSCPLDIKDIKDKFIEELLECTICLDFAISPIQTCGSDHLVCGLCFERVKSCGVCNGKLFSSPVANSQAEMYYNVDIPCKNAYWGCELAFKSTEMYKHLAVCEYRPFACHEKAVMECPGKHLAQRNVVEHLKTVHQCTVAEAVYVGENEGTFDIPVQSIDDIDCKGKDFTSKSIFWFDFDEKTFIGHCVPDYVPEGEETPGGRINLWLTVMGGKEIENCYKFQAAVLLTDRLDPQITEKVEFGELTVALPICDHQDFKVVKAKGSFVQIPAQKITSYFFPRVNVLEDGTEEVDEEPWEIKIEVEMLKLSVEGVP